MSNAAGLKDNTEILPLVLVVDDEPIILETYKAIFENRFRILTAANGKEALRQITENSISLIFLDIHIRGTNGIEILRKIKERKEQVPVIVVTGADSEHIAMATKRLGAYRHITKPFNVDEVISLAYNAIESGNSGKQQLRVS